MKLRSEMTELQLTQLMAVVAGDIFEKPTLANLSDPAGTGEGGVMSATLPYGFRERRVQAVCAGSP